MNFYLLNLCNTLWPAADNDPQMLPRNHVFRYMF